MADQDTKTLIAVLSAAAALLGAGASFLKASDKSVEQESYETLSRKIIELQNGQVDLHNAVVSLYTHLERVPQPLPVPSLLHQIETPPGAATTAVAMVEPSPTSIMWPTPTMWATPAVKGKTPAASSSVRPPSPSASVSVSPPASAALPPASASALPPAQATATVSTSPPQPPRPPAAQSAPPPWKDIQRQAKDR